MVHHSTAEKIGGAGGVGHCHLVDRGAYDQHCPHSQSALGVDERTSHEYQAMVSPIPAPYGIALLRDGRLLALFLLSPVRSP